MHFLSVCCYYSCAEWSALESQSVPLSSLSGREPIASAGRNADLIGLLTESTAFSERAHSGSLEHLPSQMAPAPRCLSHLDPVPRLPSESRRRIAISLPRSSAARFAVAARRRIRHPLRQETENLAVLLFGRQTSCALPNSRLRTSPTLRRPPTPPRRMLMSRTRRLTSDGPAQPMGVIPNFTAPPRAEFPTPCRPARWISIPASAPPSEGHLISG